MPTYTREARFEQRVTDLYATDPQFAAAAPDPAITAAAAQPGLRLPEIIKTVFDGYADRPALGQRVVRFVEDPQTHRTTAELAPQFETISYRKLWNRAQALTAAWSGHPVNAGDRVAILGFTSVDYTAIDLALTQLGAVSVPLQTSAVVTQLQPILAETEPVLIASSIDYLDDAVQLVLAGPAPKRLVVFDFRPEVDSQRESLAAARDRLTGAQVTVATLADEIACGTGKSTDAAATTEADPLALLIYTSGSTGAPKGAMYPAGKVADMWTAAAAHWDDKQGAYPAIALSFIPMSHVMGRGALYGTLSTGGTVYFAARPDLSTFLEDLALTRPTQLNLVPRVWDMIHQEVQSEVDRRATGAAGPATSATDAADRTAVEAQVLAEKRSNLLGGRFVSVMTGSAPIAPELKAWVEIFLDMHLIEGYGSTEAGAVFVDGVVRRPRSPTTSWSTFPSWATSAPATSSPRRPPTNCSTWTGATTCSSSRRVSSSRCRSWRPPSGAARWCSRSTCTATAPGLTCSPSWCPPLKQRPTTMRRGSRR